MRAVTRRRARTSARGQSGASAVEFALISVVLFPVLFGILEFGLWFNDSLNARNGVREGARAGVVKEFDYGTCTGDDMAKLACRTKAEIAALTGTSYVKIDAPDGWNKAEPLVVCALVESNGLGLMPLPNGGFIESRTEMAIEVTDSAPGTLTYTDAAPTGADWSWC